MRRLGWLALALVSLWIAGVLQQGLSDRLSVGLATPDFLLILIASVCPLLPRTLAATFGFGAGIVNGAIAGADLTHFVVSRTVTAFIVAWSRELKLEGHWGTIFATGFATTAVARVMFMFTGAPRGIAEFLAATILSAIYNGLLVLPVYALVRKIVKPEYR